MCVRWGGGGWQSVFVNCLARHKNNLPKLGVEFSRSAWIGITHLPLTFTWNLNNQTHRGKWLPGTGGRGNGGGNGHRVRSFINT